MKKYLNILIKMKRKKETFIISLKKIKNIIQN